MCFLRLVTLVCGLDCTGKIAWVPSAMTVSSLSSPAFVYGSMEVLCGSFPLRSTVQWPADTSPRETGLDQDTIGSSELFVLFEARGGGEQPTALTTFALRVLCSI